MSNIINILKSTILKFEEINIDYLLNFLKDDNLNILNIFNYEYFMFIKSSFFINNYKFYFKKNLLKYFNKHRVLYFNYENKNRIVDILCIFNKFIKYSNNDEKKIFIKEIIKNNYYFDLSKNLKLIYFYENTFEENVLYKKIYFSTQEIFIPFDSYAIKKMEYKLRTFCQIAEKLGAEKIVITYQSAKNKMDGIGLNLDFLLNKFGGKIINNKDNNEDIQIILQYPNNHIDINLNKFFIIHSIINENEFLITKEDFESDLELKFLIDARCINFIQKYNTSFMINRINNIEKKIFMKANNYGLNIEKRNLREKYVKITILIDFLQVQNNFDIIDGTNIHILREGFIQLSNIIKKEKKYNKLLRFLQSHIDAINKNLIPLNYEYDNINIVNKIFHEIIDLNFTEKEICIILENYFQNNLSWHNFKKFRDIILIGSDDKLEKIYFISFQYHDILNNIKHIMNEIDKYIDLYLNEFINSFTKVKIIECSRTKDSNDSNESIDKINIIDISNNNDDHNKILDFLKENKSAIKNILFISFKKSFQYNNGLSNNLSNLEDLINVISNIINYYFDNNIKNLQIILNNLLNNTKYNIKNNVFEKIIEQICTKIINVINLADTSPNLYGISCKETIENINKLTLYKRIQKIFMKSIIRFLHFNQTSIEKNNNNVFFTYFEKIFLNNNFIIDIETNTFNEKIFLEYLDKHIPFNRCYKNYNTYKLFYTWDDFINICNNLK